MSNNTKINLATSNGDLIATEDISGVKHELVKLEFGADGIATKVSGDNPLPVVQTGTPSLPTGAATAAKQSDGTQAAKFVDEAGTPYGVKHINNKPRVSSMPYLYDIAEGNIAGHSEFERFGLNPDIDVAIEDIWTVGGTYIFPATAQQMELVSTSAADDGSPLGTGIGVVTLYYLKTDGTAATEDITLNGTGVVTTVATDIFRVNSLKAKTVGTGRSAAGVISIRNLANTPIYSQIEVGNTRSRSSIYTVPKGLKLYVTSMFAGITFASAAANPSNSALLTLRATYDHEAGIVSTFFMPHAEISVGSGGGGVYRPFEIPLYFPAGTDLKVSASTSANNGSVSTGLRGWLE